MAKRKVKRKAGSRKKRGAPGRAKKSGGLLKLLLGVGAAAGAYFFLFRGSGNASAASLPAASTTTPAAPSRPTISSPSKYAASAYIRWAQNNLLVLGYASKASGLKADGVSGPITTRAVTAFQSDSGITADGKLGPQTELAFKRALPLTSPPGGWN